MFRKIKLWFVAHKWLYRFKQSGQEYLCGLDWYGYCWKFYLNHDRPHISIWSDRANVHGHIYLYDGRASFVDCYTDDVWNEELSRYENDIYLVWNKEYQVYEVDNG